MVAIDILIAAIIVAAVAIPVAQLISDTEEEMNEDGESDD